MRRWRFARASVRARSRGAWHWVVLACAVVTTIAARDGDRDHAATASITGIVLDSLVTDAPLGNAEIEIAGTGLTTTSDDHGRFRVDGVSRGRHRLTFFHHVLDSLGVGAGFTTVDVPDSGDVDVALTTPTAGRVFSRLCGAQHAPSTGVLVGRVRAADGGQPIAGAL